MKMKAIFDNVPYPLPTNPDGSWRQTRNRGRPKHAAAVAFPPAPPLAKLSQLSHRSPPPLQHLHALPPRPDPPPLPHLHPRSPSPAPVRRVVVVVVVVAAAGDVVVVVVAVAVTVTVAVAAVVVVGGGGGGGGGGVTVLSVVVPVVVFVVVIAVVCCCWYYCCCCCCCIGVVVVVVVVVVVAVAWCQGRYTSPHYEQSPLDQRQIHCCCCCCCCCCCSRHGSDSLEVSRWLPNRLRASTFVSRGPDQAPFPNDYGFSLSTAEPCATERREDV